MLTKNPEPEERRLMILDGIKNDLNSLEIAVKMGVDKWIVIRDLRTMKYNRDPDLKQANIDQAARAQAKDRSSSKLSDDKFQTMTGMTFQEKSFENMVNFYRSELIRIIMSEDESTAISALSKNIQRVLSHNDIIAGGKYRRKITLKARGYLPSSS
jgi:hypothetical protein